ncbi:MAG: flagellar biosynthesis protein FliQ [Syntrophomonadaceae bacterium]|jgi:flagellar biosynthetic protein FliQ|nr:flagellar biosynthesis protein FliQ [Syntrophomonadaceae bacterium]
MSSEMVMSLAREGLMVALVLAAPALGLSLLTGLAISVLQAVTQIQEQTLTFVPKIVVVFLSFVVCGPWMLRVVTSYAVNIFSNLGAMVR